MAGQFDCQHHALSAIILMFQPSYLYTTTD